MKRFNELYETVMSDQIELEEAKVSKIPEEEVTIVHANDVETPAKSTKLWKQDWKYWEVDDVLSKNLQGNSDMKLVYSYKGKKYKFLEFDSGRAYYGQI